MTTSFGQTLKAARQRHHLGQRVLADLVGVCQAAVAQWEQEATTPVNGHVFELERALRLAPGMLARHLGFGPPIDVPIPALPLPSVVDAIRADHSLDQHRQQELIDLYDKLRIPAPVPCTARAIP